MKLNRYIVPAAVMIVLTGCNGKEEKKEAAPVDEKPRVEVMLVNAGDVAQEGTYTATVEAFKTNNISSSTPNRLDNARVELDRPKKLLAIGAGTQQTVDQLQAEVDAQARQYANMVENTVLTSPISGVVTARNYDPGDMTGQLPILTIEQVQPVKVIVNISENEYSKIRKNMPVAITLDTYPDAEFTGRVHIISPTVDPATRTFSVEILIDNPGDKVLPGMFARVNLGFGSENRVVVPDRAVVKMVGSGNKYVYVLKADGTVSYNRVELGRRMGESYEVISGVADGDKVVVAGQSRLADGVAVEVIERTANTSEK